MRQHQQVPKGELHWLWWADSHVKFSVCYQEAKGQRVPEEVEEGSKEGK